MDLRTLAVAGTGRLNAVLDMDLHVHDSPDADAVVATVARGPPGLTRHELPGGVAVSYLYEGDGEARGTCQWRVLAPDGESLRRAVSRLTASLDRAGVGYEAPRFGGKVCHSRDRGPWPADPSTGRPEDAATISTCTDGAGASGGGPAALPSVDAGPHVAPQMTPSCPFDSLAGLRPGISTVSEAVAMFGAPTPVEASDGALSLVFSAHGVDVLVDRADLDPGVGEVAIFSPSALRLPCGV